MTDLTKDEIVKMAREAGMSVYTLTPVGGDLSWASALINPDQLERFATLCRAPLVAEVERLNADMKQMGTDLSAIQEIHNQQKAKLALVREQEPAGYFVPEGWDALGRVTDWAQVVKNQGTPLYATPPRPAAQEPFAWARPDAIDASQDFRFIKIDDFTVPLYATPPQPAAQEPVAWRKKSANGEWVLYYQNVGWKDLSGFEPLYPIQKSAVKVVLTENQTEELIEDMRNTHGLSGDLEEFVSIVVEFINEAAK